MDLVAALLLTISYKTPRGHIEKEEPCKYQILQAFGDDE